MANPRLELIDTEALPDLSPAPAMPAAPPAEAIPPQKPTSVNDRIAVDGIHYLSLLLTVLTSRLVATAGHMFALIGVALMFGAFMAIKDNPSEKQLWALGILGIVTLVMQFIRRAK